MIGVNNPNANLFADSQKAHLEALVHVVKILYDENLSYEIIKYVINLKGQPAEEEKMANDFNLKFDTVRLCLTRMGNDGILTSREFKRKKEPEDDQLPPGMNTNIIQGKKINKKASTCEWQINETFYHTIKQRFEDLKKKLLKKLEYMSKEKFECGKCKTVYELDEVAHKGYTCKQCDDKPRLTEIPAQDVEMLRIRTNEIIMMLSEQFMIGDKSGSGFQNMQMQSTKQIVREKKTVNNMSNITRSEINIEVETNKEKISSYDDLEDPEIIEALAAIKKDENKYKKFKEIVDIFAYK
jgi:transcription initiation factor IIE alpha subunit